MWEHPLRDAVAEWALTFRCLDPMVESAIADHLYLLIPFLDE
jgi:hypothetical protein